MFGCCESWRDLITSPSFDWRAEHGEIIRLLEWPSRTEAPTCTVSIADMTIIASWLVSERGPYPRACTCACAFPRHTYALSTGRNHPFRCIYNRAKHRILHTRTMISFLKNSMCRLIGTNSANKPINLLHLAWHGTRATNRSHLACREGLLDTLGLRYSQ